MGGIRFLGAAVALALVSGCGTWLDLKRAQAPLLQLRAEDAGIGLLQVHVEDDVLAAAPNDFSNMTGLVSKAMKDYVAARNVGFKYKDYTDLEYQARFTPAKYASREMPYTVESLAGVPVGAQLPLATVVKVLDWRTFLEKNEQGKQIDAVRVSLLLSTWTKDGQSVRSEVVTAYGRAGHFNGLFLTTYPDVGELKVWFAKSDVERSGPVAAPTKRTELFLQAVREAVALHLYPWFPHEVNERVALVDDAPLKPGVVEAQAGRLEAALGLWEQVAAADPRSHGALYDCAIVHFIKGDDAKAVELLGQAIAIEDKLLYTSLRDSIRRRQDMQRSIGGVAGNGA